MLTKPDVEDNEIIQTLSVKYGLKAKEISFLPLGADRNTAVYRVETPENRSYFLKLRSGDFLPSSVDVPLFLFEIGLKQVIPPVKAKDGCAWQHLGKFALILYPYIEGKNGFETGLTDEQWVDFGKALLIFHQSFFPIEITREIPRESFSNKPVNSTRQFLTIIDQNRDWDPIMQETAAFLSLKVEEIQQLISRVETLRENLVGNQPDFILCHGDIHAWNLLIGENGNFYMVDWDTLIFAPKERDLMFVGGGLGGQQHTPAEEERLFYKGYGSVSINQIALAYYRYNRIVEDIAAFCDQIFNSPDSDEDRSQGLIYLKTIFQPGNVLDISCKVDRS